MVPRQRNAPMLREISTVNPILTRKTVLTFRDPARFQKKTGNGSRGDKEAGVQWCIIVPSVLSGEKGEYSRVGPIARRSHAPSLNCSIAQLPPLPCVSTPNPLNPSLAFPQPRFHGKSQSGGNEALELSSTPSQPMADPTPVAEQACKARHHHHHCHHSL